ncbi:MAG: PHP domain-containing protein [Rectinemataceae bacterium]
MRVKTLVDLHNHSCLSPCASLEQSPSLLCRVAGRRGIDVLALTDHNAARNCSAFAEACGREGIAPLFGVEACSVEEVHVLCIFGTVDEALEFGSYLWPHLLDVPYDPEILGDQAVVDADENVVDLPQRYLGAALDLRFGDICRVAAEENAVVVPAHVDRAMFSVSSQLGFLPPGPYDAVESIYRPPPALVRDLAAISGSDAHFPEQIGSRPFLIDLPEDILDMSRRTAVRGGDAVRRGAILIAALRGIMRRHEVRASWESRT